MTFARRTTEAMQQDRAARKAANLTALCRPSRALVGGTYAGATTGPAPKSKPYRDRALLEMAEGRPCLLMIPGICSHRLDTVVAAHSNLGIHGKAKGRKADDCYTVAACHSCHAWLDQPIGHGGPTKAQKEAAFMAGHALQVLAWRNIAAATDEPERFRTAARRALERLGATPLGLGD